MATVKALRDHTEPKTHTYRSEGDEFEYNGEPYEHIQVLSGKRKKEESDGEPKPAA